MGGGSTWLGWEWLHGDAGDAPAGISSRGDPGQSVEFFGSGSDGKIFQEPGILEELPGPAGRGMLWGCYNSTLSFYWDNEQQGQKGSKRPRGGSRSLPLPAPHSRVWDSFGN